MRGGGSVTSEFLPLELRQKRITELASFTVIIIVSLSFLFLSLFLSSLLAERLIHVVRTSVDDSLLRLGQVRATKSSASDV